MAESSECFIIILGHGSTNTIAPDYQPMTDGKQILTLLPANIGKDCFTKPRHVDEILKEISIGDFTGPPARLVSLLNDIVKPLSADDESDLEEEDRADFEAFIESTGDYSKNPDEYYNKRWLFHPTDSIVLIRRVPGGLLVTFLYQTEIRDGGFTITKKELLDNPLLEAFRMYTIIDLSCNTRYTAEPGTEPKDENTPASIATFVERGAYGGKVKKKKTKRKSYRSKKTIRITQR